LATSNSLVTPLLCPTGIVTVAPLVKVTRRSLPVTGAPTETSICAPPPSNAVTSPRVMVEGSIVSLTWTVPVLSVLSDS